jgi:hypothetical protein
VKMPKMGVFHVGTRQVHNWTLPVLIRLFSISSKTQFYRVSRVGVAWRAAAGDTRVGSGGPRLRPRLTPYLWKTSAFVLSNAIVVNYLR